MLTSATTKRALRHARSRTRSALTVVEMVASLGVLSIVLALGLGGVASSADSTTTRTNIDDLRRRCAGTLQKLCSQIAAAERGVVGVTDRAQGGDEADLISFRQNVGFDAELEQIAFGPLLQATREGDALLLRRDTNGDDVIGPEDLEILLTRDVVEFSVTPAEDPLVSDHVELELVLRRQLGVHADGSPWLAEVRARRRVYLRESP